MPITIGTVCYRNPDLTPEQFKDYFDNTHVPLLTKLCGKPDRYRRNYIKKNDNKPFMLWGNAGKVDWDCFSEVSFNTQEAFQKFGAAYAANQKEINEDEARFFDHSRLLVSVYETEEEGS